MDKRVELTGFRDIDEPTKDLVDRNITKHLHRIQELTSKFEHLHITLKRVHTKEKGEKYEIHGKLLDNGKVYVSEFTDRNLLKVVDGVIEKIISEIEKNK